MMRDHESDRFKGFAYVEFGTKSDLQTALELNGTVRVENVENYKFIIICYYLRNNLIHFIFSHFLFFIALWWASITRRYS